MVSGVASSALGGGSDGSSSCGFFSVAPVSEDPLTFPDGNDPTFNSCVYSQGFFYQIFRLFQYFRDDNQRDRRSFFLLF